MLRLAALAAILISALARPAAATELDGFWMDSHGEVV